MFFAIISVLVCLFGLSAFFSSAETVLFSLTPRQLQAIERVNPSVGKRLVAWQKEPARILSTILAGNTLVNFAIASLGYMLMLRVVTKGTAAVSVATFTLLLLVFGEILPKQYAMRHAEKMAAFCVRMLLFWRIARVRRSAYAGTARAFRRRAAGRGGVCGCQRRARPRRGVDGGRRDAAARPLRA